MSRISSSPRRIKSKCGRGPRCHTTSTCQWWVPTLAGQRVHAGQGRTGAADRSRRGGIPAAHDPLKSQLVELRYFAGLTGEKAAEVLGIAPTTADQYWAYARP